MNRKTLLCTLALAVLLPLTLLVGSRLPGRWYYLTATAMLLEGMVPFFLSFESRRPQARDICTIAVLSALAVAARVAVVIPGYRPTMAVIMIAGIALGPESGFITGAVAALASNFFYSQGPWTPWQMMSYGLGGFLAGILVPRLFPRKRGWEMALFGFVCILTVVGPVLDASTLFTVSSRLSLSYAAAVFAAGLPFNLRHGFAVGLTLWLVGRPLLSRLERVRQKYGILLRDSN